MTFVNTFFESRVDRLFDLAKRIEEAFSSAGLEYRVIGGLAAYLYVEASEPDAGRLTKDIDIVIRREDLDKIARAVQAFGLEYRHAANVDMLVPVGDPSAPRAVHLLFAGEKVRPDYVEPVPPMGPAQRLQGIRVVPLADLVRMKLTSYHLRDQTHLKDMHEIGLITSEIESSLAPILRDRLAQVRARE